MTVGDASGRSYGATHGQQRTVEHAAHGAVRMRGGLPLGVWAAAGAALAGLLALGTVFGGLAVTDRLDPATDAALLASVLVVAAAAASAWFAAGRLTVALRVLRADTVRRLQDPLAPRADTVRLPFVGRAWAELVELGRTLEALHLRVRVADEVASRHRRTAENASAGMFELLSGLVEAEEGARGQLAAELHDTVAQSLMTARALLATPNLTPAQIERVTDYVGDAEEQVRAVMARTRPPALHDGDLAAAVGLLRDDLAARYGITVHLRWPAAPHPLPLVTAVTIYRFFQEALLNVVKHADVDDAYAALTVSPDGLFASVRDDGPGFEPAIVRPDRGRHVGLDLLRERARLAGGSLEVSAPPGRGTTLTLRLPRDVAAGRFGHVATGVG